MKKNSTFYLKPIEVIDLSSMQVFEGATNRTAVFVCEKRSRAFSYPVRYSVWRGVSRISQEITLKEARSIVTEIQMGAQPVDPDKPTSPWLTAPKRALSGIRKVIGQSGYHAFAGCCTWLNSVYWIRILGERPNGDLLIENLHDVGRIRCKHFQVVIEPDLVYPLLRGRDVQRWHVEPSVHIILPQDPQTRRGIPESIMKLKYPKTFAYLRQFEGNSDRPLRGTLRGRSGFRQYFRPTDPFYSIYNVGPYTMARWKVLWPEVGYSVKAGVCGPNRVDKEAKPSLPDHTLVSVACDSGSEAYFLAGLLNSTPAQAASGAYIVMHPSPHIMQNIAIPQFSNEDTIHKQLSELSRRCHKATSKGDDNSVAALETEIDCMAARIWGITNNELLAIQEACVEMGLTQPEPEVSKDDNVE